MVINPTINGNIFSSFILSVDGIIRKEDLVTLSNLSEIMAEKLKEIILHVRGWVNGWIEIVVARFYYHMIHGAHLPSTIQYRDMEWNSGSGLGLAQ